MSFFTFGGKLILYDYESIPLVSNTIWAYVRPRLLASNSSLHTTNMPRFFQHIFPKAEHQVGLSDTTCKMHASSQFF